MAHILLVDKDIAFRSRVARQLTERGHVVDARPPSAVGQVLSDLLRHTHRRPDVVVLDPFVPGVEAVTLLRLVRIGSRRPVLVATGQRPEPMIVRLFDEGIDGWVPKPYSARVLDAHVAAVLRRIPPAPAPGARMIGGLRLDVAAREVSLAGRRLALTRVEFELLATLAENPGRLVTRKALLTRLSGSRRPNTVDVMLSRLRSKLGESADHPQYLHVERGRGIAIRAPA